MVATCRLSGPRPHDCGHAMKKLTVDLILMFYDFPQVFIGKDLADARYVCMITDDSEVGPNFACVPISTRRIYELVTGKLDLRSAFQNPEVNELYMANFAAGEEAELHMGEAKHERLPDRFLPASDLVFDGFDEVSLAAAELATTVSFVSLEVPEAVESARIKSATLAEFLHVFQAALRNLSRVAARIAKRPLKRGDDSSSADVYGFARGSFTIKFRSSFPSDILGDNPSFSMALEHLNKFLALADDPVQAIDYLQTIKGHAASSVIRLVFFLAEHSAPIKVEWATPSMRKSARTQLSLASIKALAEQCRQRNDLTIEEVTIRGRVSKADVDTATWKIHSEEDDEVFAGEIAEGAGINLSGVVMTNTVYEFTCQEVIEIVPATGKEKRRLLLTAYREV